MSKSPGSDPIAAEIEAEITDHLASAAEQLESQGLAPSEARQKSEEKFGDPAAIGRCCYWIKQGDTLMFRTATIILLTLLCLALGFSTFSSWQSQRQMAQQMTNLAEELKALASQEKVPPSPAPPAESKPLEITGKVFVGSPDKPAANAEVMICRVSDGEIVRRITADATGRFSSGPLAAGDYTLVVQDLQNATKSGVGIQTSPIYVYAGMTIDELQIDTKYRAGQIDVELSEPLPKFENPGSYTIASRIIVAGSTAQSQLTRWSSTRPIPPRWPIFVRLPDTSPARTTDYRQHFRLTFGNASVLDGEEPDRRSSLIENYARLNGTATLVISHSSPIPLPAGPSSAEAFVVADILPHDFADATRGHRQPGQESKWMDYQYAVTFPPGAVWRAKLRNEHFLMSNSPLPRFSVLSRSAKVDAAEQITVEDGKATRIRVEIPDNIVTRIQKLIESTTDATEFEEQVNRDNPFIRPAKITVLGTEPLKADPANTPASQAPQ